MLKVKELLQQTVEELTQLVQTLSRDIYHFKCELKKERKLERPHLLREKKKERARVLTALKQKSREREKV